MKQGQIVKIFKSKKGNNVVIRYPKSSDLDDMLKFVNDLVTEDTFLAIIKKITKKEEIKFLKKTLQKIKNRRKIFLVATVNGKYAGNCEIRRRERRQLHVGEIGIAIAKAYREEGIGTELIKSLIDEGKKLGLRLLVLGCFANNPRAIHVYESLGFKRAGLIPGVFNYKGEFIGENQFYLPLK